MRSSLILYNKFWPRGAVESVGCSVKFVIAVAKDNFRPTKAKANLKLTKGYRDGMVWREGGELHTCKGSIIVSVYYWCTGAIIDHMMGTSR